MNVVVGTEVGVELQQNAVGLRQNVAPGMGAGAVRGDGETGAKRRASLGLQDSRFAFQHHSWRSLVSAKLVHRFFRE